MIDAALTAVLQFCFPLWKPSLPKDKHSLLLYYNIFLAQEKA